jgi:DNA polymerase-1
MACNHPNLQQVPQGIEYRRCFRAPEGRKLITADYSQIELRILADFSQDEGFMEAFKSGADLHRTTAAQVFNVAPEDVTSEQRSFSKRLNFGVVYGIGAPRFAMMTGVSTEEAEGMMRRYFTTYPRLDAWLRNAGERAVRERQTRTASGRLVKFRFDQNEKGQVAGAKRNGMNTPIQGTSADIFKRALYLLHNELRNTSACLVNVVHDEIVVEANESEAEEVAQKVERSMVAAGEEYVKSVPIKVEAEIKDEWVK